MSPIRKLRLIKDVHSELAVHHRRFNIQLLVETLATCPTYKPLQLLYIEDSTTTSATTYTSSTTSTAININSITMLLLWAGRSSAILEPVIASSFGQSVLFEWIKQIGHTTMANLLLLINFVLFFCLLTWLHDG